MNYGKKVIDLSDVRAEADKSGPEAPPEQGAAGSVTEYTKQEWERPLEEIEAEQKKPRRDRPPKADRAAPEAGEKKPGRGRTPKAKADKAPAKKEAPAPPSEPAQPRDATRAEKEEIVYLNLSDLHPFKDHPFGVSLGSIIPGASAKIMRSPFPLLRLWSKFPISSRCSNVYEYRFSSIFYKFSQIFLWNLPLSHLLPYKTSHFKKSYKVFEIFLKTVFLLIDLWWSYYPAQHISYGDAANKSTPGMQTIKDRFLLCILCFQLKK